MAVGIKSDATIVDGATSSFVTSCFQGGKGTLWPLQEHIAGSNSTPATLQNGKHYD